MVAKLVRAHTTCVQGEFGSRCIIDEEKRNPAVMRKFLLLMFVLRIPTHPPVSEVTVESRFEGRYTRMRERPREREKETKGKEKETQDPQNKRFSPSYQGSGHPGHVEACAPRLASKTGVVSR